MAVSGNQFTRIGASISGVGKKLTISAKGAFVGSLVNNVRLFIVNLNRIGKR